jgi:hypothetical protein
VSETKKWFRGYLARRILVPWVVFFVSAITRADTQILEEARNRNLNISRICEQALASTLDYLPHDTQSESSKSLTVGFLQRETTWAGRSAWHDRHVGIVEVPGSNPGPSTQSGLAAVLSADSRLLSS